MKKLHEMRHGNLVIASGALALAGTVAGISLVLASSDDQSGSARKGAVVQTGGQAGALPAEAAAGGGKVASRALRASSQAMHQAGASLSTTGGILPGGANPSAQPAPVPGAPGLPIHTCDVSGSVRALQTDATACVAAASLIDTVNATIQGAARTIGSTVTGAMSQVNGALRQADVVVSQAQAVVRSVKVPSKVSVTVTLPQINRLPSATPPQVDLGTPPQVKPGWHSELDLGTLPSVKQGLSVDTGGISVTAPTASIE